MRNSPSTMMIRVKLVIISSIAGRKLSEVSSTSVCTGSDQLWPPPASGWLISPGNCAKAAGHASSRAVARRCFPLTRQERGKMVAFWQSAPRGAIAGDADC
ncbi:hypothetical protein D3C80_1451570 [compost metagenome]